MGNTFYVPGQRRAEQVRALFAQVASRYDLINDLQSFGLHRYWKRRLVRLGSPQRGGTALDVCCGTADLSLALARVGFRVVGLDFSPEMLARGMKRRGQAKTQHSGYGTTLPPNRQQVALDFVQGDAQVLPFADNTFDVVSVGYGLRNLGDWTAGLNEMRRVAKRGGRLLVLDLGKPDNTLWRGAYFGYLRFFVPWLGWIFCRNRSAYAYLLESLKHYPAQHGVAAQMRQINLQSVRIINLLGGVMTINYGVK